MEELRQTTINHDNAPGLTEEEFPTWLRLVTSPPKRPHIFLVASIITLSAAGICYLMMDRSEVFQQSWITPEQAALAKLDRPGSPDVQLEDSENMFAVEGEDSEKSEAYALQFMGDPNVPNMPNIPNFPNMGEANPDPTSVANVNSGGNRMDPFEPSIDVNPAPPPPPETPTELPPVAPVIVERNPLDDLEFIGMVDEKKATNNVALLRINDPINGKQTLVKKVKEAFMLDGKKVYVKQFDKFKIGLWIDGKLVFKHLNPYMDSPSQGADPNALANGAPGLPGGGGGGAGPGLVSQQEQEILNALDDK